MSPLDTNLQSLLTTLATGGSAALVAVFLSWLAEQWPAFKLQSSTLKFLEQVVLSGALGLGAWYLLTYQPALLAQLQPAFTAIALSVAPILAGQLWHSKVNKA